MAARIRAVAYFHCTVRDRPGEAYRLLSDLAAAGVNLLAFSGVPMGPEQTQFVLFPEDQDRLVRAAATLGSVLAGPHWAFLVQGDDELGALAGVHHKLFDEGVDVYASSGVTDGKGGFGYVVYVRREQLNAATRALGVEL